MIKHLRINSNHFNMSSSVRVFLLCGDQVVFGPVKPKATGFQITEYHPTLLGYRKIRDHETPTKTDCIRIRFPVRLKLDRVDLRRILGILQDRWFHCDHEYLFEEDRNDRWMEACVDHIKAPNVLSNVIMYFTKHCINEDTERMLWTVSKILKYQEFVNCASLLVNSKCTCSHESMQSFAGLILMWDAALAELHQPLHTGMTGHNHIYHSLFWNLLNEPDVESQRLILEYSMANNYALLKHDPDQPKRTVIQWKKWSVPVGDWHSRTRGEETEYWCFVKDSRGVIQPDGVFKKDSPDKPVNWRYYAREEKMWDAYISAKTLHTGFWVRRFIYNFFPYKNKEFRQAFFEAIQYKE